MADKDQVNADVEWDWVDDGVKEGMNERTGSGWKADIEPDGVRGVVHRFVRPVRRRVCRLLEKVAA